ncbi:flagellar brake protein [Solibacillus silvestris]|uniref:flagellar brake protein n=1 Tax=Solibacillus silvestris TaxID=76853 RepID=UPI003F806EB6
MELKIGTQLILEPTYTERVEKFKCRVVEKHSNMIFIDYPINVATKKTAFLIDGAQFRVTFSTEAKESYCFNSEVLGRKGGNVQMIMLACPPAEEFIKIQRREYVRVETPVDIAIEHEGRKFQFAAEDISAGGTLIHMKTPVSFREGDTVNAFIVLPFSNGEIRYVETDAIVVKIFNRDEMQVASLNFTDTDDFDKQQIVRFCFERQVLIRKKELNAL